MAISKCAECKEQVTKGDTFCRNCGRQLNLKPISPFQTPYKTGTHANYNQLNNSELLHPELRRVQVRRNEPSTVQNTSTLAILSLVLVFIVPILGFILSFFALAEFKKHPQLKGRGYALAALILPIIAVLAGLILILVRMLTG
jgi:hypothetical protein